MQMAPLLRRRSTIILFGFAALLLIAWADLNLDDAVPLALLYIVPIVILSTVLPRWGVIALGLTCTFIAEFADAFPWNVRQGVPRDTLYLLAYSAAGFYVAEFVSRHRAEQRHLAELVNEMEARRGAEEQLRLVLTTSSLAIVTSDPDGQILEANASAESLFAGDAAANASLIGQPMEAFIPSLARVQIKKQGWQQVKAMMQCQGFRSGGEPFFADVWFSSYKTSDGSRLTSMIIDSSAEMRLREEGHMEQVLAGSRLAVGALAHEIRNLCAAISVVQANLLSKSPGLLGSEDFIALQKLTSTLGSMSSVELSRVKRRPTQLHLDALFRELYIIVSSSLRDASIALQWKIADDLPPVWADQQSLMQVVLNLIRNAETALATTVAPSVSVLAERTSFGVEVTVRDNGPGVAHPDLLFNLFRSDVGKGGFGLYLSRAMMLSFQGDLRYLPGREGAAFVLSLTAAAVA